MEGRPTAKANQSPNKWQQFRWQSANQFHTPTPTPETPRTDRIRIPIPITLAEPNFEANRQKKVAGKSSSYLFERFTFFIRSAHFSYLWQMILFLFEPSLSAAPMPFPPLEKAVHSADSSKH